MNNQVLDKNGRRKGGRLCAPVHSDGSYGGDLFLGSLVDLIAREGLAERWMSIAQEVGFALPDPPDQMLQQYQFGRCYWTTVTGGVWYLDDFAKLSEDTENKRSFLHLLNRFSSLAGTQIFAVPEDVLTLLVVISRNECFHARQIEDLGFCEHITSALADILPGQAVWAAGEGMSEHAAERAHRDR